ncbi:zinc finger protein ZAT3-like [Impatiens glandulifera]|uniref:zinc finger protein ZAT3-like n=1 Tax=Impatiens glandulifera TaxID=253017 RepID=UPI001FB14B43|nr:zinc finger protein ZAT3-like [Impatiens glandulifera]
MMNMNMNNASIEQQQQQQDHSSTVPASPATASVLPPPPSNPRKKRTKLHNPVAGAAGVVKFKQQTKKPDPSAPKITRPCSECGKKFWSWKALFGHMRCHPERQWRGINPPPNFRNRPPPPPEQGIVQVQPISMTEDDDRDVAACLLMLANSPCPVPAPFNHPGGGNNEVPIIPPAALNVEIVDVVNNESDDNCRFECSSCRKVFASHQALGGHRASHRNVKGCFANDYNIISGGDDDVYVEELMRDQDIHKCSICSRVFSSGQALGGHKRCHWEKAAAAGGHEGLPLSTSSALIPFPPPPSSSTPSSSSYHHQFHQQAAAAGRYGLDLNCPVSQDSCSLCKDCHGFLSSTPSHYTSSSSSSPGLDLRLGL